MINQEPANLKLLEISDNLRKDIREMSSDLINIWVQCFPHSEELRVTITLLDTDIVNPEYLKWLKRGGIQISNKNQPCFFSSPIMELLTRIEERIQSYGGIPKNSGRDSKSEDYRFFYRGPFLQDEDVSLSIKSVAKKIGMTGSAFLKLWSRYSWKIKDDLGPYTEAILFPFWYGRAP